MTDYPDTVDMLIGTSLTFEPQLRIVRVRGGADDEILRVPTHWHENHDEIVAVLEGKLKVTIGGKVTLCTPESGEAFIPRGVPHSMESLKGVSCVVTERTNPAKFDKKELFFRNMFALPGSLSQEGGLLPVMQIFYHGDIYPVFRVHLRWLEKAVVKVLGGYLAPLLGYRMKYKSLKKTS
ncbi:hypothetical protein DFJ43DRAFT_528556 [Lentinula guzmanii]|uniref:Cupin type-2 domain-containing protein n=1 Tax=Lentinula guzmanii TaxID=2804957 RepID=A0AA38JIZ2_9AGAR|nr:hypothetical protein DFJ43DRAFT_528556 [Lentinula guzmanii]